MKKISVIVPCYNVADYLERCMEHILKQTIGMEEIEIILIDDASTDNGATLQMIEEYERKYPETVMIIPLEQNVKQGGARNIGISYASGEYLMFCDADDWLAYRAMELLYDTAKEYDADVVEYRYKTVRDTNDLGELVEVGGESYLQDLADESVKRKLLVKSTDDFSLGCMRKLYRTSLIKNNSICFVEQLICEEPSFTLPVRLYERRHVFVDAVLYYYLQRADSTIHGNWDTKKWDNLKVWVLLMADLERREFMATYRDELEYMMYDWGLGLSIQMMLQKGYILTVEELQLLKEITLKVVPQILQNAYVIARESEWDKVMKYLLRTELTEEIAEQTNQSLKAYLQLY